jgi:hypothetical protein
MQNPEEAYFVGINAEDLMEGVNATTCDLESHVEGMQSDLTDEFRCTE